MDRRKSFHDLSPPDDEPIRHTPGGYGYDRYRNVAPGGGASSRFEEEVFSAFYPGAAHSSASHQVYFLSNYSSPLPTMAPRSITFRALTFPSAFYPKRWKL